MADSIAVGHCRARWRAGERNTAVHTGSEIGARDRGNVDDGVVNSATHNVDVAVGLESDSVGIGTGWDSLRDVAR